MKKILFVLGIIGFILNVEVYAGQVVSKKNTAVSEKQSEVFLNQKMLNEIESKKNNIIAKLKSSNQKEADRLFNQYYNEMSEYFYENGNEILNENMRNKSFNKTELNEINSKILNKYGLILEYAGEGTYTVGARPDFYYNIFKDYVSDAYKEYLKITADKNEGNFADDAGITITFKELADRIIVWENFMKKYPAADKDLKKNVKEKVLQYRNAYILGLDNTPTMFSGKNPSILEKNNREFDRFVKAYPKSPTTEIIKYFQKNYKSKGIKNIIYKKLEEMPY